MIRAEFEHATPVLERFKTVSISDSAAILIDPNYLHFLHSIWKVWMILIQERNTALQQSQNACAMFDGQTPRKASISTI